jgi:serine protease Do
MKKTLSKYTITLCFVLATLFYESNAADTATAAGPKPSLAVSSLEEVKKAVIRIEVKGNFVDSTKDDTDDSEKKALERASEAQLDWGSGFIIDATGIAITNNHVVTGAALLRVWIDGEDKPRHAKVLGVSECSDLAVIDLEGEGYSHLEWYDGKITVGLEVYAAGFPDPEFTLTRGIISKERTDGDTQWASVDTVVEHDATLNEGNSGGPLVSKNGKIIGINYAMKSDTRQSLAITRDEATKILKELMAGKDVDSIGINGQAVQKGKVNGIWVSSVKSGSFADKTRIKGGDIITMMEGLSLAHDGTMADYCDILRSHKQTDTLGIQVLRSSTKEMFEGQINGRQLERATTCLGVLGTSP